MIKLLLLFTVLLLLGCNSKKVEYQEIDFTLDSFDWDDNPYKFSNFIKDSVLTLQGSQRAAWDYSYIGDIENTLKSWDGESNSKIEVSLESKDKFSQYQRRDAIQYILEKAKENQVVIINEAHHMPQHRVFTTQLLQGLKQQGYKHLGLESYFGSSITDSIFQANGYPILKTGFYTKEPQFGNMLRVAHDKGFKVFGYESQGHDDSKGREINQALNIKKYLNKYPNEKVLIHCGFDHAYEGEMTNKWEKAMAGRLTEFTNINPLTINQVVFSEKSMKGNEDPLYQLFDHHESSVYALSDNSCLVKDKNGGTNDIFVFHPRSKKFNRPSWLLFDEREEIEFTFVEANMNCPCLVFAYKKGEDIRSAIPYDIQETFTKNVKLVLDKAVYKIVILNQNGKALMTELDISSNSN